jgi:hypothetical protein
LGLLAAHDVQLDFLDLLADYFGQGGLLGEGTFINFARYDWKQ